MVLLLLLLLLLRKWRTRAVVRERTMLARTQERRRHVSRKTITPALSANHAARLKINTTTHTKALRRRPERSWCHREAT